MSERKITVYSTKGPSGKKITSSATTYDQLQEELGTAGFTDLSSKKVVTDEQVTLESPDAVLPEGDFKVFIYAKKQKAGANYDSMGYKELRGAIQGIIEKDGDKAKSHFNAGKNYTTKGTEELRALLKKYKGSKSDNGAGKVVASVATAKAHPKAQSNPAPAKAAKTANNSGPDLKNMDRDELKQIIADKELDVTIKGKSDDELRQAIAEELGLDTGAQIQNLSSDEMNKLGQQARGIKGNFKDIAD